MGQPVVSFLNRLDEGTLNAEQRSRIRQIKQSFHIDDGDTPDRVAAWLSEDKSVWLSLLERKSEATRTTAAEQLGAILGQIAGLRSGGRTKQIASSRFAVCGPTWGWSVRSW